MTVTVGTVDMKQNGRILDLTKQQTGFADYLDVEYKRKRAVKDDSKNVGLSN